MSSQDAARRNRNAEIIAAMKAGSNLCHTDLSAFRWQPRPMIKKDDSLIKKLYGDKKCTDSKSPAIATPSDSEK